MQAFSFEPCVQRLFIYLFLHYIDKTVSVILSTNHNAHNKSQPANRTSDKKIQISSSFSNMLGMPLKIGNFLSVSGHIR